MANTGKIPGWRAREIMTASRYDTPIPASLARKIIRRDKACVYCGLRFSPRAQSRKKRPSWEHMDDYSVWHPKVWNIAVCCGSCNASRGPKELAEWFDSTYCKEKRINKGTVSSVIRGYLRRGLRGL